MDQDSLKYQTDLKKSFLCKDCNGTFWSEQAFLLHWSCNKKTRCSHCNAFGHTIGKCFIKPIPIKDFMEMRWRSYD